MCTNKDCPLAGKCDRHERKPMYENQWYSHFTPETKDNKTVCKYFKPIKKES